MSSFFFFNPEKRGYSLKKERKNEKFDMLVLQAFDR